jgi:hypothetical protein
MDMLCRDGIGQAPPPLICYVIWPRHNNIFKMLKCLNVGEKILRNTDRVFLYRDRQFQRRNERLFSCLPSPYR